jgi:hypothetical protein
MHRCHGYSETIKDNGAISEISGKEPSTIMRWAADSFETFLPPPA